MNGVHDMGGMQGFGAVVPERDEPRFHHGWERRAFALTLAMGGSGAWNLDQSRRARENLPAARYLASTYYEIWLEGLVALMTERGLVTALEAATGRMAIAPRPLARRLQEDGVTAALARGAPTARTTADRRTLRAGRRRTHAQRPSDWAYPSAALLPRQAGHDHHGAWGARVPGR